MVIERCWNDTDKGKLKLSGQKPRNVFKIRPILLVNTLGLNTDTGHWIS